MIFFCSIRPQLTPGIQEYNKAQGFKNAAESGFIVTSMKGKYERECF